MKKQSGFVVVEVIILALVIVAIGATAFYVLQNNTKNVTTLSSLSPNNYQSPPDTTPTAPTINNAANLKTAMQILNQTSISSSNTDSNQLSTQTAAF